MEHEISSLSPKLGRLNYPNSLPNKLTKRVQGRRLCFCRYIHKWLIIKLECEF